MNLRVIDVFSLLTSLNEFHVALSRDVNSLVRRIVRG